MAASAQFALSSTAIGTLASESNAAELRSNLQSRQPSAIKCSANFPRQGQKCLDHNSSFFGKGVLNGIVPVSQTSRTLNCSANLNDVAAGTAPSVDAPAAKSDATSVPETAPISQNGAVEIQETSLFISDVANLIKLVDSRDIVELELKHKNYEILIRKKEALPPPPASSQMTFPGPHVMAHTQFPQYLGPPSVAAPVDPAPAAAVEAPAAPAAAPPPPAAAPSLPPMLSPMAGTFYRCPAPGEPPFIKIGDRVTKGQVVCIVEAMKLMNEIEADQTGIIREILADDGKGVAIDTPLFIIEP